LFVTQPHADLKMLEEDSDGEGNKPTSQGKELAAKENSLRRFKKVKPKAVSFSSTIWFALDTLTPDGRSAISSSAPR